MRKALFMSITFGLLLAACGEKTPAPTTTTETTTTPSAVSTPAPASTGKQTLTGKLTALEDSGYPMAFLTVEGADNVATNVSFNQEDGKAFAMETLSAHLNKTVTIEYEVKSEQAAMDIHVNGKSLVGEMPIDGAQKLTGTLIATEATNSDLPGTFSLKMADGKTMTFDYFVTEDMVKNNGKTADVYMMEIKRPVLISLKPQ